MRILAFFLALMSLATVAWGDPIGDAVEVRIRTDRGRELPFYPVSAGSITRKVYAEATRGDSYTIVLRNLLDRRVGIVAAVDGRNVISGKKSHLKRNEEMYVLEPYQTAEISGWRTGEDRVNRFYFTSAADSYAAAFNDESAMGVIAVAVYPEVVRYQHEFKMNRQKMSKMPAPSSASPMSGASKRGTAVEDQAGTGYGEEQYSPVQTVQFDPEREAVEKIYIRYEWRESLCRKGIISCGGNLPPNRMWDGDRFAPPPPQR